MAERAYSAGVPVGQSLEDGMNRRVALTLAAFVLWTLVTVLGARLVSGGESSLLDTVDSGIGWAWAMAGGFILLVVLSQGWTDVGLNRWAGPRGWLLAWVPMLFVLFALGLSLSIGLPPAPVLALVLLNCLFVGFSEELMFRGAILQAFRGALSIWPAILLSSLMFGAVHSLNVFVTGELMPALIQSTGAFLSGLVFVALRLRTGTLWVPIVVHALWDFAIFTLGGAVGQQAMEGGMAEGPAMQGAGMMQLMPVLLVLPNAIYGLWLMRNIGRMDLR
jgi:membrane protease YdiL (CAAX protease family)